MYTAEQAREDHKVANDPISALTLGPVLDTIKSIARTRGAEQKLVVEQGLTEPAIKRLTGMNYTVEGNTISW